MSVRIFVAALGVSLFSASAAFAAPPAGAPAGTMGLCKDGSYSSGPTKSGACSGHKGVKDWYGAASTASPAAPTAKGAVATTPVTKPATPTTTSTTTTSTTATSTTATSPTATSPTTTSSTTVAPIPAPTAAKPTTPAVVKPTGVAPAASASNVDKPAVAVAAGGGPGQVWVNGKVYHCPGTKYYGTTKKGSYMTEDAAKAAGAHADHGKVCKA